MYNVGLYEKIIIRNICACLENINEEQEVNSDITHIDIINSCTYLLFLCKRKKISYRKANK